VTTSADPVKAVAGYIEGLTGRRMHFMLLPSGPRRVAVFRRPSFIRTDEMSITRERMMPDVTAKVGSSIVNGFLIGNVVVREDGSIARGLGRHQRALLNYLLREFLDVYTVEKKSPRTWRFLYPGDFVEVLIARAAHLEKNDPVVDVRRYEWHVKAGPARFRVGRFREFCDVTAPKTFFLRLLKAGREELADFERLSRPRVLSAFGRTLDVSGSMTAFPERQYQLSDRVIWKMFARYEAVRRGFLAGRHRRVERRFALPEIAALPKARIVVPDAWPNDIPLPNAALPPGVRLPRSPHRRRLQEMLRRQHAYLRDCVSSRPVRRRFKGRTHEGVVSSPDPAIYGAQWSVDHFFNSMAMADFDPALAKRMAIGGLAKFMRLSGKEKGEIPLKDPPGNSTDKSYPIWAVAVGHIYDATRDKAFLQAALPFLVANDRYLDRAHRREGILVGAGGFWNDYSRGPKELPHVAGIGANALAALQKRLLADFHRELGLDDSRHARESKAAEHRINELCWDDEAGFYFDWDTETGRIYRTPRGAPFWGLDNILPLFAGVPDEDRAEHMALPLRSSNKYGKYPAVTTDLSDDFMDERRLMVWAMTNWLVVRGLRRYALDDIADSISAGIVNALLSSWERYRSIPEALSGTHGLAPMENSNLAGVGCWAGYCLFLQEIRHLLKS
jgi:hypothetical protein